MVLSHVSGLASSYSAFPIKLIWLLTGLVTFSGFMFSFGYACQLAYFSKGLRASYQRMLVTALKPLIAFYISGIYWRAFVDKGLSLNTLINILILRDIPPYSEFLISFSLMLLIALIFFKPIQKITDNQKLFEFIFVLLLLTTLIPCDLVQSSKLALIIGSKQFAAYPILPYLSIYLLGIYFAKHTFCHTQRLAFLSAVGLLGFIVFYFSGRQLPSRFPPSAIWILASIFFVYLYYLAAKRIVHWRSLAEVLSNWGRNVLFYLLVSNILIFTFRGSYSPLYLDPLASLGVTVLMLLTIHFLTTIATPRHSITPTQKQT